MRHYEVLFIVKPTLTEDEVKTKVDFVKEVITKNGGQIARVEEMGTRKLAYKIEKYTRNIRITEDIIRFLVVKYENKREIGVWEKLSKGIKLTTIKPKERKPRAEKPKENAEIENKEEQVIEE